MSDSALDRLYETLNDLHAGDIDSFRNRVVNAFRQLAGLLKEQQERTRNQANTIISLEREVGQLKKRLNALTDEMSGIRQP
jgi:hypothetical protein